MKYFTKEAKRKFVMPTKEEYVDTMMNYESAKTKDKGLVARNIAGSMAGGGLVGATYLPKALMEGANTVKSIAKPVAIGAGVGAGLGILAGLAEKSTANYSVKNPEDYARQLGEEYDSTEPYRNAGKGFMRPDRSYGNMIFNEYRKAKRKENRADRR